MDSYISRSLSSCCYGELICAVAGAAPRPISSLDQPFLHQLCPPAGVYASSGISTGTSIFMINLSSLDNYQLRFNRSKP